MARRYGFDVARPVQWEVEALEPGALQRLVLAAVDLYMGFRSVRGLAAPKSGCSGWAARPRPGTGRAQSVVRRPGPPRPATVSAAATSVLRVGSAGSVVWLEGRQPRSGVGFL